MLTVIARSIIPSARRTHEIQCALTFIASAASARQLKSREIPHDLDYITRTIMSVNLKWVGEDQRDRIAETRMLCYAPARRELTQYLERMRNDVRSKPGEWLLAERDGVAVGTATTYAMTMWVRGGGAIPCQGVAHVGTIKTHRRRSTDRSPGIATAVMNETLRAARERNFVVSALMPFRGSF